jgi:hypothetical protein
MADIERAAAKNPPTMARLASHHVAAPMGQLPLDQERAIVELKLRGMLGDVDAIAAPVKRTAIVSGSDPANPRIPRSQRVFAPPAINERLPTIKTGLASPPRPKIPPKLAAIGPAGSRGF